jgi:hypothetical protein
MIFISLFFKTKNSNTVILVHKHLIGKSPLLFVEHCTLYTAPLKPFHQIPHIPTYSSCMLSSCIIFRVSQRACQNHELGPICSRGKCMCMSGLPWCYPKSVPLWEMSFQSHRHSNSSQNYSEFNCVGLDLGISEHLKDIFSRAVNSECSFFDLRICRVAQKSIQYRLETMCGNISLAVWEKWHFLECRGRVLARRDGLLVW